MATTAKIKFPPKYNLCRSCAYSYGQLPGGLMCGITRSKPKFHVYCPYFKLHKWRDRSIHQHDTLANSAKHGLLQYWTVIFIIIVLFSPVLDYIGNFSVYFILILALLGYWIYIYKTAKATFHLPVLAYLYAVFAFDLLSRKPYNPANLQIIYQTLVRLYGDQIAQQALKLQNQQIDRTQLDRLIRSLSYPYRFFLVSLLCQFYLYENLEACQDPAWLQIVQKLRIDPEDYQRIRDYNLSKEYEYQSAKHYRQERTETADYSLLRYYKILGLSPQASDREIKARFRYLAKIYHPDRQPDPQSAAAAQEKFKQILEAYQKLKQARGFN